MRNKIGKRFLSWVLLILTVLPSPAWAMAGYGSDNDDTLEDFQQRYGWDGDKMESYIWTGDDGKEHSRQSQNEASMFQDVQKTNTELAVEYGLLEAVSTSGFGTDVQSFVQYAIKEWQKGIREEVDAIGGTGNIIYNTEIYGRTVHNRDSNQNGIYDSGDNEFYPWSASFLSYVAQKANLVSAEILPLTGSVAVLRDFLVENNSGYGMLSESVPFGGDFNVCEGDIVVWTEREHCGIVVDVGKDYISVVAGDVGNQVALQMYKKGKVKEDPSTMMVYHLRYPDAEQQIFYFLINSLKLNTAAACGVLANIYCESGFDSTALGDHGTSYGICQWHNGRFTQLRDFSSSRGLDYTTLEAQLLFLQHDLENNYNWILRKLQQVDNSAQGCYNAAFTWCHDFEVPAGYEFPTSNSRGLLAMNNFWPKYAGQND